MQGGDHSGKHVGTGRPHAPRLCLRISRIKISKQFKISKTPEPRAIVSHDVGDARDVGERGVITVVALVEGLEA